MARRGLKLVYEAILQAESRVFVDVRISLFKSPRLERRELEVHMSDICLLSPENGVFKLLRNWEKSVLVQTIVRDFPVVWRENIFGALLRCSNLALSLLNSLLNDVIPPSFSNWLPHIIWLHYFSQLLSSLKLRIQRNPFLRHLLSTLFEFRLFPREPLAKGSAVWRSRELMVSSSVALSGLMD